MNDEPRPNPDELLKAITASELRATQGHLRVFLGMSAGVGKTYAMLRAAHQRLTEGVDVVIGIVETHGRSETAAMIADLPIVPLLSTSYKGTSLNEMNLDAILVRKPSLVLVDELAHSNVPGSRHQKRYKDVIELLENGIDVFTTVNVQHLESRKEAIETITQVTIRETVPDSILDRAHLVELVDIAPSELLKRLAEGKVYLGANARAASENFFKEDRLTALREIALRITAERVDHDLRRLAEGQNSRRPWNTNERLMVALSHSPHSEMLIRTTRRIAYNLEAPWIALYVDAGTALSLEDQQQLAKNISLARELGAEVVTTTDIRVVDAINRVARQKSVTQIIVGRPTKRWLKDLLAGGTLLDRLVRESTDIDVHVLRNHRPSNYRVSWVNSRNSIGGLGTFSHYWHVFWLLTLTGVGSAILEPLLGYRAVGFLFLLSVSMVGIFAPIGPVVFAATLGALSWNFFFIPPRLTFVVSEPADVMMCIFFFAVALITGFLTNRIRAHELLIRDREERTNALYEVLQDISSSRNESEFLVKVTERMGRLLDGTCGIMVARGIGDTQILGLTLNPKESAVAAWALTSGMTAGWSTATLSESSHLYVPLRSGHRSLGLFIYHPRTKRRLNLDQENLIFSVARQVATALEKQNFERRARETQKLEDSEKLHQTLLNSISHEMRTPLTIIMGIATALTDGGAPPPSSALHSQVANLLEASDRLNRVVENLLDMTRLNSGVLTLKKEWNDVRDLVGSVLKKLNSQLRNVRVQTILPDDLPVVEIDFRLVEHAIANLVINAATYSSSGTTIKISATRFDSQMVITVQDEGPGVPEDSLEKIFDKFYRVPGTRPGGTGLGLSIVKSIAEAHGGSVVAENLAAGGMQFLFRIPLAPAPAPPVEIFMENKS